MKVLMLSHLYPRPNQPSRAVFIRRQVQELRKCDIEFHVISPQAWSPLPGLSRRQRATIQTERETPDAWEMDHLPVYAPRHWKLPGAIDFGTYARFYYRSVRPLAERLHAKQQFDLIHAQMLVPDGNGAVRLGRDLGLPVVVTERGYLPTYANGPGWNRRAAQYAIQQADVTLFVCQALAQLALTLAKPKQEPTVVYTGLDAEMFSPGDRQQARQQLGLPSEATILLLVGENVIKKGFLVLLQAMPRLLEKHKNLLLCVVGGGGASHEVQQALHNAAARSPFDLRQHVRLLGSREHRELPTWYAASNIVTLPSAREGLPNSLVEAAACARPVVASRVMGIPEIVVEGETGLLVPAGDVDALTTALDSLLANPEKARQFGEQGKQHVVDRFSWKKHREQMQNIYHSMLQKRSP